jgi:DNA mismatch repair ATPase MutL
MICPKCGKENTPDEVFCTQCGELLLTFSHSDENNTASAQSPEPTDAPSSPAAAQTQANSTNRSESTSNSTRSSSKPQKSTKTKTKKRSAPAKNSRSKSKKSAPKRTKEPKQPKERRPKQQGDTVVVNKTVKKGGCGCLSFVLAGILVLILAAVVAGGIFVYRYGYDNILAHFGYELTSVKDESSSADESAFSSLPDDDTTSDTVSEDEDPAFSSKPAVSDVISAEE